ADPGQEARGFVVPVDQITPIIIAAGGAGSLSAEKVVEAEELRLVATLLGEGNWRLARPHFAQHTPVVGGVAYCLIAIGITRAHLYPADEGLIVEIVCQVGFESDLLAVRFLEVIHGRAPELHALIPEILLV